MFVHVVSCMFVAPCHLCHVHLSCHVCCVYPVSRHRIHTAISCVMSTCCGTLYIFLWCSMCVECIHVCVSSCSVCLKNKQCKLVYCHSTKHKANSWRGPHESQTHFFIRASSPCRCTTVQSTQAWVSPKPTSWSGIWNQATWWWPSRTCLPHPWPRSAQTSSSNGWGGVFIFCCLLYACICLRVREGGKTVVFLCRILIWDFMDNWGFLAVNHLGSCSQSDHK